jgi:hypothetical protein
MKVVRVLHVRKQALGTQVVVVMMVVVMMVVIMMVVRRVAIVISLLRRACRRSDRCRILRFFIRHGVQNHGQYHLRCFSTCHHPQSCSELSPLKAKPLDSSGI